MRKGFIPIVIVLVIALLVIFAGAYILGKSKVKVTQPQPSTETQVNTPTAGSTVVTAGGLTGYPKYSITVPDGWTASKTEDLPERNYLTLTKNSFQLFITQGGPGEGVCDYSKPERPESGLYLERTQLEFVPLQTKDGNDFRRTYDSNVPAYYTICEKIDSEYKRPTTFGFIIYKKSLGPGEYKPSIKRFDDQTLSEMDSIVASLKKQ